MSERTATARRIALGVPFLFAYALVLFPVIFAVSIVLGAVDAVIRIVTGSGTRLVEWTRRLWDWNGGNARFILTGRGSFDWTP